MFKPDFFESFIAESLGTSPLLTRRISTIMTTVLNRAGQGDKPYSVTELIGVLGISRSSFFYAVNSMNNVWSMIFQGALAEHDRLNAEQLTAISTALKAHGTPLQMDFPTAISLFLDQYLPIRRAGWDFDYLFNHADDLEFYRGPYTGGEWKPWLADASDMLATDWEIAIPRV
ncbi:TPA: hypothetical protein ACGQ50_000770 [Enterobacter cloacae]